MRMLWWICGHTRRDRVWNDDICKRLGVAPVEEKLVQHCLRWFGHMQQRSTEAPICNRVIRWTDNEKRDRGRPNLTREESMMRDLNDWCITKELALDRREWKLVIHVSEPWYSVPSLLLPFCQVFSRPFLLFWLSVLLSFLLFRFDFLLSFVFTLLFRFCFVPVFLAHVVSSLAYPNLLSCCCVYIELWWPCTSLVLLNLLSQLVMCFQVIIENWIIGWMEFSSCSRINIKESCMSLFAVCRLFTNW
jgi:hypothetical protein